MINSNIMPGQRNVYVMSLIAFLILGAISTAGWFGYAYYRKSIEESAHKDFAQLLTEYEEKSYRKDNQVLIDIEKSFATGAQRHKGSSLYPYFLAYQSEALLSLGKTKEALEILNQAINNLNKKSPLYDSYLIKRALIKTDIAELKNEGKQELENLAKDSDNANQDMAIYYLGLSEFGQNKEAAKKLFETIVNKNNQESNWYYLAKSKLESL